MKNNQGTPEKTSGRFLEITVSKMHMKDSLKKKKIVFMGCLKSFKEKKKFQKEKRLTREWYREGV